MRFTAEQIQERRLRGNQIIKNGNQQTKKQIQLELLSTFNIDMLSPFVAEALDRNGLYGQLHVGEFGQIIQPLVNLSSELYERSSDTVAIIVATEDMLVRIFERPGRLTEADMELIVQQQLAQLQAAVETMLSRLPRAICYVVPVDALRSPSPQVLNPAAWERGQQAVDLFLSGLRKLGVISPRIIVVDFAWHTRQTGLANYFDTRLWYLARMRLNPQGLAALADTLAEHIAAQLGKVRKLVAVDLDNTMWGGIVGEDGLSGLKIGEDGVGFAFQEFQRVLLRLADVGIVVVLCSKNNPEDVWEVFDKHAGMILKRSDVVTSRINWQDKATNLREIAEELSLGIDSFVFLDDNPVERGWVRSELPEVLVPELPEDPAERPLFVESLPVFRRINLTEADVERISSYKAEGHRYQLRLNAHSIDDFLISLEQKISLHRLHEGTLARAAQLCQRTNQFNLTTIRYTIAEIEDMLNDSTVEAYTMSVSDRFSDNGIIGLGILRLKPDHAEIDTFLMSCRVLGRKVENTLLNFLLYRAQERGKQYVIGRYVPTNKNQQTTNFFPDNGFSTIGEGLYQFNVADTSVELPSNIEVEIVTNA